MKNKKIKKDILIQYIEAMNSLEEPMTEIKEKLNNKSDSIKELKPIIMMINELTSNKEENLTRLYTDTIKQIMSINNGTISTRMIEPLNISREYLSILERNNEIEKVSRGIYILPNSFEDSYFSFQQKHKKAIFSHMNALYFYGLTEEFPYEYTVTVPQRYHVDKVNKKCNVFYVADDTYEIGVIETKTPNGNKVKAYDRERSICDIIRSSGRMDREQVEKTIKNYIKCADKNMKKLYEYSQKMGIKDKVMKIIGGINYE